MTDHRLGKGNMSWNDMMEGDGLMIFVRALREMHDVHVLEEKIADLEG